jgi:pre-mRNA-splicing factor CWC22
MIRREIIGGDDDSDSDTDSSSSSDSDSDSDSDSSSSSDEDDELIPLDPPAQGGINGAPSQQIQDYSEKDLINLRRTIYLTIVSSATPEECAHKMLKIDIQEGQEIELCAMILECCSQERTYTKFFGLLGERFCLVNGIYVDNFEQCFAKQYETIHRLETNKLRNVAKFFAHLLFTDALPWTVFEYIQLSEETTTSSSRIFVKILFQELAEHLGLKSLHMRLTDKVMQPSYVGIFPKDNPKDTRFAINYFVSIGLGALTEDLRQHLKDMPKRLKAEAQLALLRQQDSDSDSSSSSDSSDSDSSDSDSSDSGSDSDSDSSDSSDSDSSDSDSSDSGSDSDSDSSDSGSDSDSNSSDSGSDSDSDSSDSK